MKRKRFFVSLAATLLILFIIGVVTKKPVNDVSIDSLTKDYKVNL